MTEAKYPQQFEYYINTADDEIECVDCDICFNN